MATDAQSLRVERSLSKSKRPHLETKAQVQEPDEYRRQVLQILGFKINQLQHRRIVRLLWFVNVIHKHIPPRYSNDG
jgi:hypothetical protein